jgi:dolichyl-phosphate beta-glucosyltransferase
MKIGIIITFCDNENDINRKLFSSLLSLYHAMPLCFVNNGSKDNTLEVLKLLKEKHQSKVSIIDIKRNKGTESAIKAGARYLFNTEDLKHIGYIDMNSFNSKDFNKFIYAIEFNKDLIIQYNNLNISNNNKQGKLLRNIFSIVDYLKTLNVDFDYTDLDIKVS